MLPVSLLVKALLAYSVHEHQLGHVRRIDVQLEPEGFVVADDGRGMGLDRDGYVSGLIGTLVGGSGGVQLHGVGLSVVAAMVPMLEIASCRAGVWWVQVFARGVPSGPPRSISGAEGGGTRITASEIGPASAADVTHLLAQIEHWQAHNPGLTLIVHDRRHAESPCGG